MTTLEPSRIHEDDGLRAIVLLALFAGSVIAWVTIIGGLWLLWRYVRVEQFVAGVLLLLGLGVMALAWWRLERLP